jgi:hypothetical protein
MSVLAIHLGAVPFKKIVRWPSHARGHRERLQALLATQLLIAESPAQPYNRQKDKIQHLEEV